MIITPFYQRWARRAGCFVSGFLPSVPTLTTPPPPTLGRSLPLFLPLFQRSMVFWLTLKGPPQSYLHNLWIYQMTMLMMWQTANINSMNESVSSISRDSRRRDFTILRLMVAGYLEKRQDYRRESIYTLITEGLHCMWVVNQFVIFDLWLAIEGLPERELLFLNSL